MSARAPPGPELTPPRLGHPVGIRVHESGFFGARIGECVEQRSDPVGEPSEDRVRERHSSLEPRTANELDGLVHCRITRDAVDVAQLIGP